MARTTVNVDMALLDGARQALGTVGLSETVNAALAATARRHALAGFDIGAFDVTDEDIATARRDRSGGQG
jgi:Arc/MetJ family transcription regulator